MITQFDLAHYLKLREANDRTTSALTKARLALIDAHAEDPTVEPGPITLKIEDRLVKRFSYIELVGLLGKAPVDELKERLPGCPETVVTVRGPAETR